MKKVAAIILMVFRASNGLADESIETLKKIIAVQQAKMNKLEKRITEIETSTVTTSTLDSRLETYATKTDVSNDIKTDIDNKLKSYPTNSALDQKLNGYTKCDRRVSLVTSSGKYHLTTVAGTENIQYAKRDDSKALVR